MEQLPTPTSRELAILKVLWSRGPSSVREVHAALNSRGGEELAFNTVQTMLRIMEGKRLVGHRVEGRTFIYSPRFSREESARRFVDRVFDGAASELVRCLIQADGISAAELERVSELIARARKQRREGIHE